MPERAKLQYFFTCDAIVMSPEQKPTFFGVFTSISSAKFPCVHNSMGVAFGVRAYQPCLISMELVAPSGEVIQTFEEIPVEVQAETIIGGQYVLSGFEFPDEGEYRFRLRVDGEIIGDTPIVLTQVGEAAQNA